MENQQNELIIVTGLSGAGMSSSLKHLEDMGYEVFDNFPLTLVDALLTDKQKDEKPVAIGIDARTRGFSPDAIKDASKKHGASLLFLTCDENILIRRFTETRRRHPMAEDRPAAAGVQIEIDLFGDLQESADHVIDTTTMSVHDLRSVVEGYFARDEGTGLTVTLMSFGFRTGIPREADIVMDVRFLQNPHWVPELRPLTGKDRAVGEYIEKDEGFDLFTEKFKALVEPLLPRYAQEGKSYLTIAIGCTGGRHRSVYTVEKLKPWLEGQGFTTYIVHKTLSP